MELQIFKSKEFGNLRTIENDGDPWFVGKDVAEALGYAKARNAISKHVDDEDRKDASVQSTPGETQTMTIINKSGVYALVFGSKLPSAKRFKHWVTSEVLPTIRKHGAYMTDEKAFDVVHNASGLADLLQQAAKQLKQKDMQIEWMRPKEIFSDAVATSHTDILIGELAEILKGNGIEIGQNRLFAWLRENGYLIRRKGTDYNMPTQKAMESKLFRIKETAITHSDGHVSVSKTPKVTGSGQVYFVNKFLKMKARGEIA